MAFSCFTKKIKTKINPFCKLLSAPLKAGGAGQKTYLKLGMGILALFLLFPPTTQGRTFNPHNIITDQELLNKDSLSETVIRNFLTRKNSVLARYSQIIDGKAMKVSEMIWEISQKHGINPKFLLATLEKEQGLIHKSQATKKAMDWATGYGCYGGGCKEKYRGFYNQVEATAETQKIYWQKAGQFAFSVGQTTTSLDGFPVTPANKATANLYIYTPYVGHSPELGVTAPYGGNRLFWRIWHRYFTNQKFLDGQIITHNGDYWKIANNQKKKFVSQNLFLKDYNPTEAINVSSKDLAAYPDGRPINFGENSLVKSAASGQIYLLTGNQKRPIIDNAALALLTDFKIAITANEIPGVAESQLTGYSLGTLISNTSIYPQGKLFQDETGKIWQVKDNLKHEVDSAVWQNRFKSAEPETITLDENELEKYPTGSPVKLKDGTFVTVDSKYYLISNGERMKIENLGIFNRTFGLTKKNSALKISVALLEIHEADDTLDYIDDTIQDPASTTSSASTSSTGSYAATFNSMTPDGLIMMTGESVSVTLKFKNNGSTIWQDDNVYLKITDKGQKTSSFGVSEQVNPAEGSVSSSQLASFTFNLTAPTDQNGLLNQEFGLYYNKNNTPTKITSIAKFIIVKPGVSAQILEQNIPVAVRNDWRPIPITMKIQNTSADTAWYSNKTALEIYNLNGSTSHFYDPYDWVRKEVAAVPINDTYIEPGEIGEFKFTLDPRGITPGFYILNFQLKLLDQDGKQVFLNGREQWHREIRVD